MCVRGTRTVTGGRGGRVSRCSLTNGLDKYKKRNTSIAWIVMWQVRNREGSEREREGGKQQERESRMEAKKPERGKAKKRGQKHLKGNGGKKGERG